MPRRAQAHGAAFQRRLLQTPVSGAALGAATASASATASAPGLYCSICAESCPAAGLESSGASFGTPARPHTPTANALLDTYLSTKNSVGTTVASAAHNFAGVLCSNNIPPCGNVTATQGQPACKCPATWPATPCPASHVHVHVHVQVHAHAHASTPRCSRQADMICPGTPA